MSRLFTYVSHFLVVALVLVLAGFGLLVANKGSIGLGTDELAFKVGNEGPYVFTDGEQLQMLTIRGERAQGFWVEQQTAPLDQTTPAQIYFALEDSFYPITIQPNIQTPAESYSDEQPIVALSDLEGNFKAFRDFLIAHEIVDQNLQWQFGHGHLVLVGDMVDRGSATTQLLWLIHDLEQQAQRAGGHVHYIIGNHELKNLSGDFSSAAKRYIPIAGILGKTQAQLFGEQSVLGQWLASKNSIEQINGYLFVHGGLHPDVASLGLSLAEINQRLRANYRAYYYPKPEQNPADALLLSNQTGLAWFRGYFKDAVTQAQIDATLAAYEARGVVVGHTLQFNVNRQFNGKVFAIDVKHPEDYTQNIPAKSSQGLLLEGQQAFRLLDDGSREAI